jgi:hypothetical protein
MSLGEKFSEHKTIFYAVKEREAPVTKHKIKRNPKSKKEIINSICIEEKGVEVFMSENLEIYKDRIKCKSFIPKGTPVYVANPLFGVVRSIYSKQ